MSSVTVDIYSHVGVIFFKIIIIRISHRILRLINVLITIMSIEIKKNIFHFIRAVRVQPMF